MSIKALSETIKAMMSAGCTEEQIKAVLEVHEKAEQEVLEKKREKERLKKRRQRTLSPIVPRDSGDIEGHLGTQGDLSPSPSSPDGFPPPPYSTTIYPPSLTSPSSPSLGQTPPKVKNSVGTRLPPDWEPKEHQERTEELEKFRDYWIAQPGVKGRKLDWDATWRNWIRNSKPALLTVNGHPARKERDLRNVPDSLLSNDDYWKKRTQLREWK
jgi:hypothetical protein